MVAPTPLQSCLTPWKAAYATEEEAQAALAWIRLGRGNTRKPTDVYRCRCGRYHLTSRPRFGVGGWDQ